MKKSLTFIVFAMIAVIAAGGIFLWYQQRSGESILEGLDPESYDVEATCIGMDGNNLHCNAGNDNYLYLEGSRVLLRNYDVVIRENGDEEADISYRKFSLSKLKKEIEKEKEVPVYLWLTANGKVETIMVGRESFENHNGSLANLDGLDPNTASVTKVILSIHKTGMKMAPAGYTPETADKFEGMVRNYRFAKNVKFYRGTVTITVSEDGTRRRNLQYSGDSYEKLKDRLSKGQTAHIWFNKNGRISAVLAHEEKVILE